jgi:hypothetical protein
VVIGVELDQCAPRVLQRAVRRLERPALCLGGVQLRSVERRSDCLHTTRRSVWRGVGVRNYQRIRWIGVGLSGG